MSHFRSWRNDEDGRIGLVVLLIGGVEGLLFYLVGIPGDDGRPSDELSPIGR